MPYCTFAAGTNQGNSAGQGEITGDSCFPIGLVAQQSWDIDTTQSPQVIQVTFSGGQEGRQTVASVTCDPSADDPTFTVKGETRTLVYEVDITSKFACGGGPPSPGPPPPPPGPVNPTPDKKPDGGTIFTGLVLGCGFGYLIFGFIYNVKVKQADGWDRVPNRAVWGSIFGSASDGCKFVKSKVTGGDPTYSSL